MPEYDWGTADPEGFDALLHEEFVEYKGMVFRKTALDKTQVEDRLKEKSFQEVQRELNHTHLVLYVEDIDKQRRWARELEEVWAKKIKSEFPRLRVEFAQDDDGQGVIVTLWAG